MNSFETRDNLEEIERQYRFIELLKNVVEHISAEKKRKPTACVETFGCQMNARDSEKISGILLSVGFEIIEDENADLTVYNTCSVRDNANQKVYGRLGRLSTFKKNNPEMKIALCGCMTQEEEVIDKLCQSYGFVDLIFGTHNLYRFAEYLYYVYEGVENIPADIEDVRIKGHTLISHWNETDKICEKLPVDRKYFYKSGVNIMFGCNNFCSYCIVPYVRGRERSREADEIIAEIENLVKDGVIEVMLLGQNVNSYGKNLEDPISFAELLRRVEKIEGLERIRFMTSHPKDLSDELIEVIKNSKKICHHLHLPLQSGSSRILKSMNRVYDKEKYLDLALKIRREIPDISITTDIIVGFPGETKEDVDDTLDVIRKVEFDNAFTFIYSVRTGTPAAKMEQLDEKFVKEQFDRVLSLVQETARKRVELIKGLTLPVLVEEINKQNEEYLTGRLSNNTIVHFKGNPDLIGKIVNVKCNECKGFYYIGEVVE
ncbi:MAG: tRNA (N6-isopentenyl adenosine(37)-C2)-methylthiotransferase MiaB [Lachnospiraceae bacterium]|nr:tRNA (N6-isopentenyl adenosine(37)-C2)-methylthiotransferase MiaB [Lachnospiraceae bacterium]